MSVTDSVNITTSTISVTTTSSTRSMTSTCDILTANETERDKKVLEMSVDISRVLEWSGKTIRIFGTPENPWFHGSDLATALGYAKPGNAILMHVSSSEKCTGSELNRQNPLFNLKKYEKQAVLINKRGACSLFSASKIPNKGGLIALVCPIYGITFDIITRLSKEQEYIGSIITSFAYCNPQCQFRVGSYRIDVYLVTERIAIECDEFNHNRYDQSDESKRQEFITKELGCKFIRFNPDDPNFSIFKVIHDIGLSIIQSRHMKVPI